MLCQLRVARTDSVLFGTVLTNVFSNAIDYTPDNGSIDVQADATDQEFNIKVANTTDTMKTEDMEHIFDTFWRSDGSRTVSVPTWS